MQASKYHSLLFCSRFRFETEGGPNQYAFGYGAILFLCFLGCNPQWLYDLLQRAAGYHPYDATHVITQLEILLFSALAFTLLNLWANTPGVTICQS